MFKNPFSFDGRIRRTEYGLSFIIFVVARIIVALIAVSMTSNSYDNTNATGLAWLFSIPLLWFFWAQGAKRCHDVGNNGWWQLIPLYPLWLLFQDGHPGINEYGVNPKGIGGQNISNPPTSPNPQDGFGYTGGHNSPNTNYGSTENPQNKDGYKDGEMYK